MQDIEYSVIYDNSQKQSRENSVDNDFEKEMVSMLAEFLIMNENKLN